MEKNVFVTNSQSSFRSSSISDGFTLDSAVFPPADFDAVPEVFTLWDEVYTNNEQIITTMKPSTATSRDAKLQSVRKGRQHS